MPNPPNTSAALSHEKSSEVLRELGVLIHKINNPLTALLGRAQILRARAQSDPQVLKAAQVIEESAMRIAEISREMSHLLRNAAPEDSDLLLGSSDTCVP